MPITAMVERQEMTESRMKENGLRTWWKREWGTCLKAVILACLPILACLIYCAAKGQSISQIYLPSSERNDELIYYKQVEAILNYGFPKGYFGFNESHALRLSFAAWSPVLMLPWVLWGLLFGWNLMSPILCNIFLLTMAMLIFGLLAKPDWKQLGITALLFFLFQPFTWYMLCCMPEIFCFSLLIIFYGGALAYLRKESRWLLGLLLVLAGLLTWMRPYLFLFLLLPAYFWISRSAVRWKAILGTAVILAVVLGIYGSINHFLAAEYFRPLFDMSWLTTFFEKGLVGGLRNFFGTLYYSGREFLRYMEQGITEGLAAGGIFCCYIAMLLLLFYQSLRDFFAWRRGRAKKEVDPKLLGQLVLEVHLTFAFVGMLGAVLLMCNFFDGCKHMLGFLVVGILVIARMNTAYFKKAVFMGVVFAGFFFYRGAGFEAYQPDFVQEAVVERMDRFHEAVSKELTLTLEEKPNYDNTVIWVLTDDLPEGIVYTGWQYLYSLPGGFGISCCTADYVMDNLDSLKSKYLCVVPGGPIEERCLGMKYEKIVGNEYAVLYRRY